MAEYLIKDTTLTGIADAIRGKTGGTDPIMVSDFAGQIEGISGGGGGSVGNGDYLVQVVDYDGTVLSMNYLNEGDVFTLPDAPTHEGLVFDGWSSPVTITNNTVTVEDQDITIGPMFHTESGATEFVIELTEATGLTMTFYASSSRGINGVTSIDWGDGTVDSSLSHTYSDHGKYTIKAYGVKTIIGASGKYIASISSYYSIVGIHLASNVTIGGYAFNTLSNLKSVAIPYGITSVGEYAFQDCSALKSITFPSSVTTFGDGCFYNCKILDSVTIPLGVTELRSSMFYQCHSLRSVSVPSSVVSAGTYLFYHCYGLGSIRQTVGYAASYMYASCYNLKRIKIPAGTSAGAIQANAFAGCQNILEYDFSAKTLVPKLADTSAFYSTNVLARILVPASLYDEWVAAENWASYATRIVAV